jgi:hypothetical protein
LPSLVVVDGLGELELIQFAGHRRNYATNCG